VPGLLQSAKKITDLPPWFHGSVYGPPGCGKTKFAAEMPKCLILDCDGTGAQTLINWPELSKTVDVIRIRKQEEMMEIHQDLRKMDHGYESVSIDTASQLQLNDLQIFVAQRFKDKPQQQDRARLTKYMTFQSDYGESTNRMRDVIVKYFDLPMNVLVLCHQIETKDDGDNTIYIRPALTPKLTGTLAGLSDFTAYMTLEVDLAEKETRKLRLKPTRRIQAKTRIHMPRAEIIDPTFAQLMEARKMLIDNIAEQMKVSA